MANPVSGVFPVNELGEILLQSGTGTNNKVANLPSNQIPHNSATDKMVVKLPVETATFQSDNASLNSPNGTILINQKRRRNAPVVMSALMPTAVSSAFTGTHNLMTTAPGDFDAVAAVAINYDTSAVFTLPTVAYAVSERSDTSKTIPIINGVQYNTLAGATDQLGFVPGSWPVASVPIATTSTFESTTVTVPQFVIANWTPLSSIARVDNPAALPLVICREFFNNTTVSVFSFANAADVDALNTVMAPHEFYQIAQGTTDGVSVPSAFTTNWAAGSSTLNGRILAMAYRLRGSNEFILVCGDSIAQGIAANGDTNPNKPANNWNGHIGLTVKGLTSKTRPIASVNIAFSGMKSFNYLARLKSAITQLKPSMATYPVFTPNDSNPGSVATLSAQFSRALDFIDICEQNNVLPILYTAVPGGGVSETTRQAFIAKIKALRQVQVVDISPSVTDATNVAQNYWRSDSYFDNTHPSTVGHQNIANNSGIPYFRALLGS